MPDDSPAQPAVESTPEADIHQMTAVELAGLLGLSQEDLSLLGLDSDKLSAIARFIQQYYMSLTAESTPVAPVQRGPGGDSSSQTSASWQNAGSNTKDIKDIVNNISTRLFDNSAASRIIQQLLENTSRQSSNRTDQKELFKQLVHARLLADLLAANANRIKAKGVDSSNQRDAETRLASLCDMAAKSCSAKRFDNEQQRERFRVLLCTSLLRFKELSSANISMFSQTVNDVLKQSLANVSEIESQPDSPPSNPANEATSAHSPPPSHTTANENPAIGARVAETKVQEGMVPPTNMQRTPPASGLGEDNLTRSRTRVPPSVKEDVKLLISYLYQHAEATKYAPDSPRWRRLDKDIRTIAIRLQRAIGYNVDVAKEVLKSVEQAETRLKRYRDEGITRPIAVNVLDQRLNAKVVLGKQKAEYENAKEAYKGANRAERMVHIRTLYLKPATDKVLSWVTFPLNLVKRWQDSKIDAEKRRMEHTSSLCNDLKAGVALYRTTRTHDQEMQVDHIAHELGRMTRPKEVIATLIQIADIKARSGTTPIPSSVTALEARFGRLIRWHHDATNWLRRVDTELSRSRPLLIAGLSSHSWQDRNFAEKVGRLGLSNIKFKDPNLEHIRDEARGHVRLEDARRERQAAAPKSLGGWRTVFKKPTEPEVGLNVAPGVPLRRS